MTLSLYIAHGLVFNFIVHWMGWVEPSGLDLALVFTACYWVAAITLGSLWHRGSTSAPPSGSTASSAPDATRIASCGQTSAKVSHCVGSPVL